MLSTPQKPTSLAVLTSGGDAAGMNPAVRAVVRTGLHLGLDMYAVYDGLQGLVDGGESIRRVSSHDVGGILQQGGTVLGTARSQDFRTRDGRRIAARNLVEKDISALVVVGGDGSLTGANLFRQEWPDLLAELVEQGEIEQTAVRAHRRFTLVGLVGSIDNDMFGTDMTIGAARSGVHGHRDAYRSGGNPGAARSRFGTRGTHPTRILAAEPSPDRGRK